MLPDFTHYINDNELFTANQRILLAVSGGLDSTVMAHLFHKAGFSFGIAHCNFALRGNDSDGDEAFVRQMANDFKVPFFTKKFQTVGFSESHHLGIQEAARILRYDWFSELIEQENFYCLATAHHQDDHIETFFLNLLRGCGISGLHGILKKRDRIIRPLLFATRGSLEEYAKIHQLKHREDNSNQQTKYTRNKIRHSLIPALNEIQLSFQKVMVENMDRFFEVEKIYEARVEQVKNDIVCYSVNYVLSVDIKKLQQTEAPKTFLFEIFKQYGFKKDVISDILESLRGQSGKRFFSERFILIKDRKELFLYEKEVGVKGKYFIDKETTEVSYPIHLKIQTAKVYHPFSISKEKTIASLDADKLIFPLIIRKPMEGDRFTPLGMKGQKKLSDFFINEKFTQIEKENTWLLCSGDDIVCIINHRISDLYKITDKTNHVFILTCMK